MKIKLIIDSPHAGLNTKTVDVQSNISEEDIRTLYKLYFGVDNLFCSYEIVKEGD
jgi:hypothetical protein